MALRRQLFIVVGLTEQNYDVGTLPSRHIIINGLIYGCNRN